jgi:hypothetical protein
MEKMIRSEQDSRIDTAIDIEIDSATSEARGDRLAPFFLIGS